jgi:hypothetical protein
MPSKSAKLRAAKKRAVPRRELLRRVAVAVDMAREAATSTLGDDLDSGTREQALLWIFGYLTGLALGGLISDNDDQQFLERLADKALAAGIDEYVDNLNRAVAPTAELQPMLTRLQDLARRLARELPPGVPKLAVVK